MSGRRPRSRRQLWALAGAMCALVGAALLGIAPTTAAAAVDPDGTSRLASGQCLKASAYPVSLESPSGRFSLTLFPDAQFTMDDNVEVPGAKWGYGYSDIWGFSPHASSRASVCMQTNGDLVLRAGTKIVWHTRTAQTAAGGYAQLLDSGAFAVKTRAGHTAWWSHSTAVLMVPGDKLASGHYLVNRTYPGSTSWLEMRSDGDLVLLRNHTVMWHSNTHVHGSYLWVTPYGRLAISGPKNTRIWNTPAYEHSIMRLAVQGRLVLENMVRRTCWQRPGQQDCDAG